MQRERQADRHTKDNPTCVGAHSHVTSPHTPTNVHTVAAFPRGGWACRGPPCPRRSPPPPNPRSAAGCTVCSPGCTAPPSPARRSRACKKSGEEGASIRGAQAAVRALRSTISGVHSVVFTCSWKCVRPCDASPCSLRQRALLTTPFSRNCVPPRSCPSRGRCSQRVTGNVFLWCLVGLRLRCCCACSAKIF